MPVIKYQRQKGNFVKHCPCSPETVSCGYYNLNLHTGCAYDCSYCILQAYLESKEPVFYTNIEDMERELAAFVKGKQHLRIGSGELSDSLVYEPQANYAAGIMALFEQYPQVVFEFKTKSANVKNILTYPGVVKNIVISWSLNPQSIIDKEETGTPSLSARLSAMAAVQERGYKIGIHFDPMLAVGDWQDAYDSLIREIASVVQPEGIAWWSLGTLRFPYALRAEILKHPESQLFSGELIKGYDGKYRYFKPLRLAMFHGARDTIRSQLGPDIPLYLCMEDAETWQAIFPEIEPAEAVINRCLYESVFNNLQP
jgi:spore photoproduct lyase